MDDELHPESGLAAKVDADGTLLSSTPTDALLSEVYVELRELARHWLVSERPGNTLQPTALVHEAYLRIVKPADGKRWANRAHFFAAAAEAMRRILIESARRKSRIKHGGERQRVELGDYEREEPLSFDEILDLDAALTQLAAEDAEAAEIVKLHFFAGVSIEEAGEALGISRAEAYRQWSYARAWLRCAMGGNSTA
jgi:RNA polymerase sigma factor (TIGR02999 family)